MGEVFAGRYELVDPLGAGGMGSVWRAWDHRARAYVAAKVLRQGDASALLRFVREQSFRIHHPNVVTPRNWAGEDERVLFTMDLVRGGTLSLLLQRYGRLSPQWVAVLTDQILAALSAVHNAGVIHRDIKPGNIMLEPTGRARPVAKLMDFGVAVPVDEPRLTRASQMLGTPGYLAPEVFTGVDPEPRHDIYSMGVLAAEMLSGRRPDPDSGIPATAPENVPPQLWDYVRKLGAWPVGERPESCRLAREWLAELGILPAEGVPPADPTGRIQVFDVVGPLPSGWGPEGPLPGMQHGQAGQHGQRPAGAGAYGPAGQAAGQARPDGAGSPNGGPLAGPGQSGQPGAMAGQGQLGGAAASAGPGAPGQPSGSGPSNGPGQQPAAGAAASRTPATPTRGVTPPTAHQRSATPIQPQNRPSGGAPAGSSQPGRPGSKRRRRWPLAVASIVLVVAGLVLGSSIWWADSLFGADTPDGDHTPRPTTASTAAVPLDPNATAGGACDFTEVGSQASTSAGELLICRKQGGAYVWKTS